MQIATTYTMEKGKVTAFSMSNGDELCSAKINDDGETYTYTSNLRGDIREVTAPIPMSLANCILTANVNLGFIPPQNFDPIPCNNQH